MRSSRWGSVWCLALLWLPLGASATLGGNAATVDADRAAFGLAAPASSPAPATGTGTGMSSGTGAATAATAAVTSTTLPGTTVQTLTLPSGTVVREYLSTAGVVFAVAWQGPVLPQLRPLLGADNFSQYTEAVTAAQTSGGGHGAAGVSLPGLVVNSSGHMGAFFGRAWLPPSLPAGVSASDIQ
jgi:Protein of unknown function (DUF2844)